MVQRLTAPGLDRESSAPPGPDWGLNEFSSNKGLLQNPGVPNNQNSVTASGRTIVAADTGTSEPQSSATASGRAVAADVTNVVYGSLGNGAVGLARGFQPFGPLSTLKGETGGV